MKKISALILLVLLIASCSTKFSLQKRKYTKGFYFAHQASSQTHSDVISRKYSILKNETVSETVVVTTNGNISESLLPQTITTKKNQNVVSVKKTHHKTSVQNSKTKFTSKEIPKENIVQNKISLKHKNTGPLDQLFFSLIAEFLGQFPGFMALVCLAATIACVSAFVSGGEGIYLFLGLIFFIGFVVFCIQKARQSSF